MTSYLLSKNDVRCLLVGTVHVFSHKNINDDLFSEMKTFKELVVECNISLLPTDKIIKTFGKSEIPIKERVGVHYDELSKFVVIEDCEYDSDVLFVLKCIGNFVTSDESEVFEGGLQKLGLWNVKYAETSKEHMARADTIFEGLSQFKLTPASAGELLSDLNVLKSQLELLLFGNHEDFSALNEISHTDSGLLDSCVGYCDRSDSDDRDNDVIIAIGAAHINGLLNRLLGLGFEIKRTFRTFRE